VTRPIAPRGFRRGGTQLGEKKENGKTAFRTIGGKRIMTPETEQQRVADERLVAALKAVGVFARQDELDRIFYTDGEDEYEVAVVLAEDADGPFPGGVWTIGQYALGQLEAGDIEMLWWPMDEDDPVWGPKDSQP
jgi:hypothetical protein